MVTVEITRSLDYDLVGRIVAIDERLSDDVVPLPAHSPQQISTGSPLRILA
jgi:hypothetical protein